ncbi:hypothetical protein PQX77_015389 [Marasmius sp. AFHP31]|nr:hypothetical protein PQX77_015389 [Marasmius sp. AFHP31]
MSVWGSHTSVPAIVSLSSPPSIRRLQTLSCLGKARKDPSEQLVDKEFMKRDYKLDKDGRLHQNQPSSSSPMEIPAAQNSGTGGGAPGKGDVGD